MPLLLLQPRLKRSASGLPLGEFLGLPVQELLDLLELRRERRELVGERADLLLDRRRRRSFSRVVNGGSRHLRVWGHSIPSLTDRARRRHARASAEPGAGLLADDRDCLPRDSIQPARAVPRERLLKC